MDMLKKIIPGMELSILSIVNKKKNIGKSVLKKMHHVTSQFILPDSYSWGGYNIVSSQVFYRSL